MDAINSLLTMLFSTWGRYQTLGSSLLEPVSAFVQVGHMTLHYAPSSSDLFFCVEHFVSQLFYATVTHLLLSAVCVYGDSHTWRNLQCIAFFFFNASQPVNAVVTHWPLGFATYNYGDTHNIWNTNVASLHLTWLFFHAFIILLKELNYSVIMSSTKGAC